MNKEQMVNYLNTFNVATFEELRTWSDKSLKDTVKFIKAQLAGK